MTQQPEPRRDTPGLTRFFLAEYPRQSVMAVVMFAVAGFTEGFGVLSLVPVLEVAEGTGTEDPSLPGRVVASVLGSVGLEPTLPILLSLVVVAILTKSALVWYGNRQVGFAAVGVACHLRERLVSALLAARWSHYGRQTTGALAHAIGGEAVAASAAFREGWAIVGAVFPLAAYAILAATISWQTSLFALVAALLLIGFLRGFVDHSRQAGSESNLRTMALATRVIDTIRGLKPIKAMAREDLVWPMLQAEVNGILEAEKRRVKASENLQFFHEPVVTALLALGIFVLLGVAGQPLSSVVVLAFVFYRVMQHIKTMQMRYQVLVTSEPAFWSFLEKIEEAEEAREIARTGEVIPMEDELTIDDLWFSYDEGPVLRGVSMVIPAGSFIAIHGESGSGKTTLVDLIAGLYEPEAGRILVDGRPLADLDLMEWRHRLGYVPQEMLLLMGSVLDNVTLNDPSVDRSEVERALRMAGAWNFVSRLPKGMDTQVGEHGAKLSGGQRQRVAIARALAGRPSLLILDEVTTALDPETEAEICATLAELRGEVTILSISHQEAMRRVADETMFMADGTVTRLDPVRQAR